MSTYFIMQVNNPQPRLIQQSVATLKAGSLIVFPTEAAYSFGCLMTNRAAQSTIRQLSELAEAPLTLLCDSIAQASQYVTLSDYAFRLIKSLMPGSYTFILPATKRVPRYILSAKRKGVGVRFSDYPVAQKLVEALGSPLLTAPLCLGKETPPLRAPQDILAQTKGLVQLIMDGGLGAPLSTTVLDLTQQKPILLQQGMGEPLTI